MDLPFATFPIIDSHVHFVHPGRMDEMLTLMESIPCTRFNLVSIPTHEGGTGNPVALKWKQHFPERTYISGALEYAPVLGDLKTAPDLLAAQVLALKARGFDGLKLIEGKPQVRKLLPHRLDGLLYAGMWAVLEEISFPVVFHVADPDEFWNAKTCPDWARRSGWDYTDGSFPSKEELYTEVDSILARHPHLNIIFAHFYFLSRELERAGRFLDTHPGVYFDLAPHVDMYRDFSAAPRAAKDFFLRYQDRIIFGTDSDTRTLDRGQEGLQFTRSIPRLMRSFLEHDGEFSLLDGGVYHGLGLPGEALTKIYAANFERIYGAQPAKIKDLG
jgi:predicted TIM-barrel fold metal-dependent hydrolase